MSFQQRDWLRAALSLAILAALVLVGRRYLGELHRLREADLAWVGALALLILLTRGLNSEITWLSLRVLGHPLGRGEVYLLSFLRTYSNLLVPRAGIGVIGAYLKAKHGIRFADSTSLVMPNFVVQMAVIGLLGLAAQPLLAVLDVASVPIAFSAFFGLSLLAGSAGVVLRFSVPASWTGAIGRFARRVNESWRALGGSRYLMTRVAAIHCVLVALRAAQWWIAFAAVGLTPHKAGLVVASLLSDLMFLISVTPNGLGFQEAAMVYSAEVIGVEGSLALTAAILLRIVLSAIVVVVAQLGLAAAFAQRGASEPSE